SLNLLTLLKKITLNPITTAGTPAGFCSVALNNIFQKHMVRPWLDNAFETFSEPPRSVLNGLEALNCPSGIVCPSDPNTQTCSGQGLGTHASGCNGVCLRDNGLQGAA